MSHKTWWQKIPKRLKLKNFDFNHVNSQFWNLDEEIKNLSQWSDDLVTYAYFLVEISRHEDEKFAYFDREVQEEFDKRARESELEGSSSNREAIFFPIHELGLYEIEDRVRRATLNTEIANKLGDSEALVKFLEGLQDDELGELMLLAFHGRHTKPYEMKWIAEVAFRREHPNG